MSNAIRASGEITENALVAFVSFISIYLHTRYTESKPSHLGIALIMKDKRSKIKTNANKWYKKMMMLQCVSQCVCVCECVVCMCASYLITYTYILMSLLIIILLFSNSLVYTIVKSGRNWRTRTYTFINKTSAVERRITNRSMNSRLSTPPRFSAFPPRVFADTVVSRGSAYRKAISFLSVRSVSINDLRPSWSFARNYACDRHLYDPIKRSCARFVALSLACPSSGNHFIYFFFLLRINELPRTWIANSFLVAIARIY